MYEQPPSRRRIGPALIAVLVLVAASVGTGSYFVVRQALGQSGATGATGDGTGGNGTGGKGTGGTGTDGTGGTGAGNGAGSGPSNAGEPPGNGAGATPASSQITPGASTTSCPAITVKAVSDAGLDGKLTLLRYVAATPKSGSPAEAWVCRNSDGVLFYQGHRLTGPFTAATSDHTLLLGKGIRGKVSPEGDGFVAINPVDPDKPDGPEHTDYHLSRNTFYFVKQPEGEKTTYDVTATNP